MSKRISRSLAIALFSLVLTFGASSSAFGAATIVILNNDAAGVGFNDPTAVAPVGGNPGTTRGQQRLIAFQAAAAKWGATLDSTVPIIIQAQWTGLTCTATQAVLGSAGATFVDADFPGAPFAGTLYSISLANKILGFDEVAPSAHINANFNVNLGNTGCLTGTFFYLGLDNNHGANIDLVTVLTHEFGHGLGFQTFTNGSTGAQAFGLPSVWDRFLVDDSTGKSWFNMTNAERVTSALNTHKLAWNGPQVSADVPSVLSLGIPILKVNSPAAIAGSYDVGTAAFGAVLTAGGVTGNVVQALDPADGAGPLTTDGCSALTNAAAIAGNIALIDRGTCGFTVKAKNAQDAGAVAVVIVNNAAGSPAPGLGGVDPTVTIPTVSVTQSDGNIIKAQLGAGVNGTVQLDTTVRAGADAFGKALLFSPNPFQGGSSVSHWDTIAFPNQLMEPAINGDLTHEVTPPFDLSFSLMRDIGWVPSNLATSIANTSGDNQGTKINTPFPVPLSVTVSPNVFGATVTWTANPNPAVIGASGTFATTLTRFATSTTDDSGVATAPAFIANGQAGYYSVNATVPGAGTTTFSLRNMLSPTAAPATISGRITTADGSPVAGVTVNLNGAASEAAITNSNGDYGFNNVDTESFYTVAPSLVNYHFSPANRSFSLLANKTDAVFTAVPDALPSANPIDTNEYFVRQHYRDFLGREPDQNGLAFWSGKLNLCNGDAGCLRAARVEVSAAFFQSAEFNLTGSYVYRLYAGSLGRQLSYNEFATDRQQVIGGANLEANKAAFTSEFVNRAEFVQKYQANTTAGSFVDALLQSLRNTAGADLDGERTNLLARYNTGATINESRALVLRAVGDNASFSNTSRNPAFVLMEYFGYLGRTAEPQGYAFWLNVLNNTDSGNYRGMVCSFLTSTEYQRRFGTVVTRSNAECSDFR